MLAEQRSHLFTYLYLFHKISIFGAPVSIQNSHVKYCNTVQYRYIFLSMKTESRAHKCDGVMKKLLPAQFSAC